MSDKHDLLRAIEKSPDDAAPKFVLADWYAAAGYPTLATIWRWIAQTGRYPSGGGNYSDYYWQLHDPGFPNRSGLPEELAKAITGYGDTPDMTRQPTLELVVAQLVPAWAKITKGSWFKSPWVPDMTPIQQMDGERARLLKVTKGIR